jgi:Spy/CpxP family protein refolding chaperone
LLLGGAFVLGGVSAAAGYHAYALRKDDRLFSGDREAFETRRVQAMTRELELSTRQAEQVREIFVKHAPERQRLMREAMESCGAAMSDHRERIDQEIRSLLDPAQAKRFETLRAERRKRLFGGPAGSARGR